MQALKTVCVSLMEVDLVLSSWMLLWDRCSGLCWTLHKNIWGEQRQNNKLLALEKSEVTPLPGLGLTCLFSLMFSSCFLSRCAFLRHGYCLRQPGGAIKGMRKRTERQMHIGFSCHLSQYLARLSAPEKCTQLLHPSSSCAWLRPHMQTIIPVVRKRLLWFRWFWGFHDCCAVLNSSLYQLLIFRFT